MESEKKLNSAVSIKNAYPSLSDRQKEDHMNRNVDEFAEIFHRTLRESQRIRCEIFEKNLFQQKIEYIKKEAVNPVMKPQAVLNVPKKTEALPANKNQPEVMIIEEEKSLPAQKNDQKPKNLPITISKSPTNNIRNEKLTNLNPGNSSLTIDQNRLKPNPNIPIPQSNSNPKLISPNKVSLSAPLLVPLNPPDFSNQLEEIKQSKQAEYNEKQVPQLHAIKKAPPQITPKKILPKKSPSEAPRPNAYSNPNRHSMPDSMSYEELLKLDEDHYDTGKGFSEELLSALNQHAYDPCSSPANICAICQFAFQSGEIVTFLPCVHVFHYNCIYNWLSRQKRCGHGCPLSEEIFYSY
jgi:hypothetical protein